MRLFSEYNIQFAGLKQGSHFYEFSVDRLFFEEFDCFDFDAATFKVELELKKQSTMMIFKFKFLGSITVSCDRCAGEVTIPISGEEDLVVKFGNEVFEETDEILVVPENENEINVAQYIYEFIRVSIPQKKVHKEGNCNQDAINRLNELSNDNENRIDPRWSGLEN